MLEENGKLMRITRETLGYSYSQVEEATKVRELYLQLLESGDLAQMPGRIYAIGFADTYARFLGMDPAPILADVKAYYEVNSKQNNFEAYVSGKKVVQTMAEGGNYDPTLHDMKSRAQSRLQDQNTKADSANQLRAQAFS
ncbi:MAG: helix-turn-helix transcriptional regulator, partial [Firmicutes bacterium]|nr:helix-turn-helix transcriptional regulator [Bacillota bacterium]